MSVVLYGIPNCDTVKKARRWLEARGVRYDFHDYKKQGVPRARLERWVAKEGWERLLNRRGTAFRKLPDALQTDIDAARALAIMEAHASTIKRPVVEHPAGLLIGFDEDGWGKAFR
ncbi:MAG: arsenate reductase [Myxococcota bacterium]